MHALAFGPTANKYFTFFSVISETFYSYANCGYYLPQIVVSAGICGS